MTAQYRYVAELGTSRSKIDTDALIDLLTIHRVHRSIIAQMDRYLAKWKLNTTWFWLLINVVSRRDDPPSPAELAEECGIARPTMTSALNVLQRRGLLRREEDAKDHRMFRIRLTDAGEAFMKEVFPQLCEALLSTNKYLSGKDRAALLRLFQKAQRGVADFFGETS